jgi:CRP-like cAMP-binding protein
VFRIENLNRIQQISNASVKHSPDMNANGLSGTEWRILLTGAEKIRFEQGASICIQGKTSPYLYYHEAGLIEFDFPARNGTSRQQFTVNTPGYIFGESAIFRRNFYSVYTVRVKSSSAIVLRLRVPFILNYLKSTPSVALRFFTLISKNLAQYILSQEPVTSSYLIHSELSYSATEDTSSFLYSIFPSMSKQVVIYGNYIILIQL